MGRFKALTLASVLALGAAQAAQAADLLPPPPPLEAPLLRGPVVEEPSGFYLRADVGVGVQEASSLRSSYDAPYTESSLNAWYGPVNVGDSALYGLGAGYQFNSWFRADVTGEYRSATTYNAKNFYQGSGNCAVGGSVPCGDNYNALVRGGLFLGNVYADLWNFSVGSVYVGAGVGVYTYGISGLTDASISEPNGWGVAANKTGANLAWALMTGFAFNLAPNLKLDVGYRYVNMGTLVTNPIVCSAAPCYHEVQRFDLASSDMRVGLRWLMAGPVYEPALPVRAKY